MTPPIVSTAVSACDAEAIAQAVHSALALLAAPAQLLPDPYRATSELDRLAIVVAHNLASGRFARACRQSGPMPLSLHAYTQRVAAGLAAEWEYVSELRRGSPAPWTELLDRLERKAYLWYGPTGRRGWAHVEAADAAARTCADLWCWLQEHLYPFDVPFAHWSACALRHRLLDAARGQRTAARHLVDSLDRPLCVNGPTLGDLQPADGWDGRLDRLARQEALQRALAHLEKRQAQVVRWWYLEGWPAAEIAERLRVSVGCVYIIKHRALRKLRADPALRS